MEQEIKFEQLKENIKKCNYIKEIINRSSDKNKSDY